MQKEPEYRDGKLILQAGPPKKDGFHYHGTGKFKRTVWGPKEQCKECSGSNEFDVDRALTDAAFNALGYALLVGFGMGLAASFIGAW